MGFHISAENERETQSDSQEMIHDNGEEQLVVAETFCRVFEFGWSAAFRRPLFSTDFLADLSFLADLWTKNVDNRPPSWKAPKKGEDVGASDERYQKILSEGIKFLKVHGTAAFFKINLGAIQRVENRFRTSKADKFLQADAERYPLQILQMRKQIQNNIFLP